MKKLNFNRPDEARRYIDQALEIVNELEVPDDLREVAFGKACDLLSGAQLFFSQADAQEDIIPAMAVPTNKRFN